MRGLHCWFDVMVNVEALRHTGQVMVERLICSFQCLHTDCRIITIGDDRADNNEQHCKQSEYLRFSDVFFHSNCFCYCSAIVGEEESVCQQVNLAPLSIALYNRSYAQA